MTSNTRGTPNGQKQCENARLYTCSCTNQRPAPEPNFEHNENPNFHKMVHHRNATLPRQREWNARKCTWCYSGKLSKSAKPPSQKCNALNRKTNALKSNTYKSHCSMTSNTMDTPNVLPGQRGPRCKNQHGKMPCAQTISQRTEIKNT